MNSKSNHQLQLKTSTQNPNSIYYFKPQLQTPSLALAMNSNSKFQLHILTQYFSPKHLIGYFYLELVLRVGIWSWSSNIISMGKIVMKLELRTIGMKGFSWS